MCVARFRPKGPGSKRVTEPAGFLGQPRRRCELMDRGEMRAKREPSPLFFSVRNSATRSNFMRLGQSFLGVGYYFWTQWL